MMDIEGRDPYLGVDILYLTVDDGDVPNYTV